MLCQYYVAFLMLVKLNKSTCSRSVRERRVKNDHDVFIWNKALIRKMLVFGYSFNLRIFDQFENRA